MKKIDFWFSVGSTYTFLTIMRVTPLIKKYDLSLNFYPFNLRKIMTNMQNFPFSSEKKIKLQYMWRDIERRSENYKIGKIKKNINFPIKNSDTANKVAILAKKNNFLLEYLITTYKLWFFENIEPGSVASLQITFNNLNKNLKKYLSLLKKDNIDEIYKENTSLAIKKGIFGSPTFLVNEEVFFGDDRLDDAILFAKKTN
ncbi:MAG: 2-hydroxychromene-2-carboxylate isomerase [Alphaproteobacteria bacterium MarineAlpha9_Bin4]|nr:2-hydroxychromene-2-carboxylate isomerase [Pelagibacterales bacterium]PPR26157.1 MAG: 2-hydroxychromene-2-carboxylate isomerase [Alphaproteobacteria bacterium MarineAlpha9_Bin4]|tara:strand:+ start:740 stop:1339 length:600 start_codon:yes stop_codon:yes gene_type:complete